RRLTLAQPEDGALSHRLRNLLPLGVGAQRLLSPRTVVLGQGEDSALLDLFVVGEPEDRVQGSDRPVGADLGQPEYGLAAHLRIGIAPNRLQQDVLGSRLILLGYQENGLTANAGSGRIALREHATQDGAGPSRVHLLQ